MPKRKPLSETEPLTLMISSRCTDAIFYRGKSQPMGVLRRELKSRLQEIKIAGKQVFKVWIHEDESTGSASANTWEMCLEKARQADVFLALYNGRSGWIGTDGLVKEGIGICHAELAAAYDKASSKVRSIQFIPPIAAAPDSPDDAFQRYFTGLKISGAQVKIGEEALQRADELAVAVVLSLAREGVGVNSSGYYYTGEALEWTRMNFQRRREVMTASVVNLLKKRAKGTLIPGANNVAVVELHGTKVGFVCDSIPAPMSTASAREKVGQPFLNDHEHSRDWNVDIDGPVHLIACQKGVTEAQALKQLGFPDAQVVPAPFGVYVADDVQNIQMAFIANCRDETSTQGNVQAFVNWLFDHGEAKYLVRRASRRRRISNFLRNPDAPSGASSR